MLKNFIFITIMLMLTGAAMAQDTNNDVIYTDNTNTSDVNSTSNSNTTVKSPPPSAISPSINSANSDLCTTGVSGAVQTQILGISAGKMVRDMNCEKLKNAKVLYDMGMKVAAVSVMCQDERVFDAMMNAGTPCPYQGMIGAEARTAWEANQDKQPSNNKSKNKSMNPFKDLGEDEKSTIFGGGAVGALLLLLLL